MGAIGALMSAVNDALAPFGVVADQPAAHAHVPARTAARRQPTRDRAASTIE